MTKKNKNMNNKNMEFNVNGNNNTIGDNEIKRNINNQTDKSIDNSKEINNIQINKFTVPERIHDEKERQEETLRPALKDKEGKRVICFGYVVHKRRDGKHTVINLVDIHGKYLADHVQINFKEKNYDYGNIDFEDKYIKITGIVDNYNRQDKTNDYSILIEKEVEVFDSIYYNPEDLVTYDINDINIELINSYLSRGNVTTLYDMLDNIRNEINKFTRGTITDDFLYYYLINQYTFNTAVYKIYNGNLRDQGFDDGSIIDLLILLGSVLYELKSFDGVSLYELLNKITISCNIFQGINSYNESVLKLNQNIRTFYKYKLLNNSRRKVGESKITNAIMHIKTRQHNFEHETPNDSNTSKEELVKESYCIINEMINKN